MDPIFPNAALGSQPSEPEADGTRTERRHDLLALAVLALLTTILFADVLAGVNQFYMRDLTRYYYPTKQVLRDIVYGGEVPYWNRYFSAGQPIAANPEHEVFYPLTWLILLPSYDLGFRLLILSHIYIALFGMYCLLRSMELRPFSAFIGALSFGLGGLFLSYINLLPILFCAAWIPLTCLYVRRFLLHKSLKDFALGSLFFGLQILVAEPTTILQTGALLGFYALYRAWYSQPRLAKAISRVLWIATFCGCALLVGAAQILPAIDHIHDSARSRPFEFSLVSAWSLPWAKLAEAVFPNILGHISIDRVMWYWGGGLYPGMGSPFLFSIYCGLLITAIAIGGAFARPRGGRLVLILVAFSLLIALGGHTPLFKFLYDYGIATSIRYPEKFILLGLFAVIVFGAQMLDRLVDGDQHVRDGALGFVLATTVISAVLAGLSFTHLYATGFSKIWGYTAGPVLNRMVGIMQTDWIVAVLRGGTLAVLIFTATMKNRRLWTAAVAIVVVADLGMVTYELNPRMPRRFFDPPPAASQFPKDRGDFRIFHEADWYGQEEIARTYFSTGSSVYWVVRNGLFPMTTAGVRLRGVIERDYDKTALLPTIDLTDSVWDVKRSGRGDWAEPFMAMSNAWYHGVYQPFADERKRVKGDFTKSLPVRFNEGTHWPRYYFSDQLVTIHDRADFAKKLSDGSYSRKVAFVARPTFVPARGVVYRAVETNNTAVLDVESFGQGFLVMSVTPHKYWRIEVTDAGGTASHRVPAITTNVGYQGIVVTPGRHIVRMVYRNELVIVGTIISLIATLALLFLAIRGRHPHVRPGLPAYEEAVHVVEDAAGVHAEAVSEKPASDSP